MAFKMEKCPQCEKSMPKHILVKHLAKTHGVTSTEEPEKVDANVVLEEKPAAELITESLEPKKDIIDEILEPTWYMKWNAGEIMTCAQCHSEWPDKLMRFHLKFDHGL